MAVSSRLRHVVESQQFSRSLLEELFARSEEIKREPHRFMGRLAGQVMAALFYEPSTRTRLSFEAAMLRLGGQTMGTDNAREFSSTAKGETLEDTIRIVSGYADVVYQTRIQKERFTDPEAYQAVKGVYRIDKGSLELMRKYAVLMHPLPRVDEIAPEVDADPRAAYFRQARNGLQIRMALLDRLLS